MLHTGILPHHANWSDFFTNLKFIVIDEAHTYRGVFGSHVANVIRRLKRVANFYGAKPQFILASATIGNPKELAETLIEEPVELVDNDGSSRGERHFIIYNPPVTDAARLAKKRAARKCAFSKSPADNARDIQSVVFARTRRSVEIILTHLQGTQRDRDLEDRELNRIRIRSRIPRLSLRLPPTPTPRDRAGTCATARSKPWSPPTPLNLGIDIGGLGAAILVGYPGTIASARQQAGRAGRGDAPAVSIAGRIAQSAGSVPRASS
jgi:DEAD/DEAH box helicase domain-containing protein